jgi:hypothetical protein
MQYAVVKAHDFYENTHQQVFCQSHFTNKTPRVDLLMSKNCLAGFNRHVCDMALLANIPKSMMQQKDYNVVIV